MVEKLTERKREPEPGQTKYDIAFQGQSELARRAAEHQHFNKNPDRPAE